MTRDIERHSTLIDRRELMLGAGAAVAVACIPFSSLAAAVPSIGAASRELLTDWTIDDMWGVYPRPHEAIGFSRPRGDGELLAAVAPVDAGFLA
jgi:hypothetical protein